MTVRRVAEAVRYAALAGVAALAVVTVLGPDRSGTAEVGDLSSRSVLASGLQATMDRHGCSTRGLGEGLVPGSALVRSPSGRVRATSFDRGWAVAAGDGPGDLVAVCRDGVRDLRETVAVELPWPGAPDGPGVDGRSLRRLR